MSRIYDNQALSNLPVNNVKWSGVGSFDQSTVAVFTKESPGVLLEGILVSQARICISNASASTTSKGRYYLLNLKIVKSHKRKFDERGNEIEPNFSETTKVSTGYLNSSYDVKAKGNTDRLANEDAISLVQNTQVTSMIQSALAQCAKGDVTLLMKEVDREKIELTDGASIRVKTVGNSPFIESLVIRDEATSSKGNFVGDQTVGGNWTEKIMAAKSTTSPSKDMEDSEIADEEWDD